MPTNYNVRISPPDPDLFLAGESPYASFEATKIQLYRWTTEALARAGDAGTGTLVETWDILAESETITEAEGPYSYQTYDASQLSTSWYRWRVTDDALAQTSQFSVPWRAGPALPTVREIMFDILNLLGETGESGTATAGTTTTVTSAATLGSTLKNDNDYRGHWLIVTQDAGGLGAAPEGEEALIASNVASTGVATLDRALTTAVANGDRFLTSALIRPSEMLRCINRAREGMKFLTSTDIAVYRTETLYPAPAGIRTTSDIYEVLGVTDLGTETNAKALDPVLYQAYQDGPQIWLHITEDTFSYPMVRVRYETSYRDYEGELSLMSDTTIAPREWLRAAAAMECMEILVRDDPGQGEFQQIRGQIEAALQVATGRYATRMPARKVKAPTTALIGPRTW